MNKVKALITIMALALSGAATAALDLQVEVVEMSGAEFSVPANEASRIKLDGCATCALNSVRVTTSTIYRVAGENQVLSLAEFRKAAKGARGDELALFYVAYDAATGRVTEIALQDSE